MNAIHAARQPGRQPELQTAVRYRDVTIGSAPVEVTQDAEGVWRFLSREPLQPYPRCLTDRLQQGASQHPDRTLIAERDADGQWREVSYAHMVQHARSIGQALLDRGLSTDRPLLILSGNDIHHLQLAMGAMYAGIPFCPLSPSYSLLSEDFGKLRHALELLTPGMVYASDGDAFARAINAVVTDDVEVVLARGNIADRQTTAFAELLATMAHSVDEANERITPEQIAKFLFTSGSTKLPKAVITTHQMLCANQQMLLQTFPCFGEEAPVLLDWLPWNHTFGGSHNVGIALYNGGSYYIDEGKPTEKGFAATLRNLHDISPTVFFNVPKGWELLTDALNDDASLREKFFSRMKLFFFAGAGLSQAAWDRLDAVSESHCGERIRIMSGLGMTETSPSCTFTTGPLMFANYVGLPAPGCEVKVVPMGDKAEARFRGSHVMPGYWRMPEQTAEVFDEEGYYCSGDAIKLADDNHPEYGLAFDGRITEDFKLSSGTFVSVGPMRARLISQGAPYVQDAVITGMNRDDIGVMIFPRLEHCQKLAGLPAGSPAQQILDSEPVRAAFAALMAKLNLSATGSATRIAFLHLLVEPPAVDQHEITDKGSINQRAVLTRRAALIESMYSGEDRRMIVAAK